MAGAEQEEQKGKHASTQCTMVRPGRGEGKSQEEAEGSLRATCSQVKWPRSLNSTRHWAPWVGARTPGLHPSGLHSSGIHASGLHPSGFHPSGLHAPRLHAPRLHPSWLHAPGLHPSGLHAPGLHPSGLHAPGLHPSGLHAPGLHPSGLHAPGLHPSGLHAPGISSTCREKTSHKQTTGREFCVGEQALGNFYSLQFVVQTCSQSSPPGAKGPGPGPATEAGI
uniref:Uncharacterized protein n=1 Tax=Chelonoidis abingdonii TaxID=106734 RepID=A0A8C0GQR3_CHEAB